MICLVSVLFCVRNLVLRGCLVFTLFCGFRFARGVFVLFSALFVLLVAGVLCFIVFWGCFVHGPARHVHVFPGCGTVWSTVLVSLPSVLFGDAWQQILRLGCGCCQPFLLHSTGKVGTSIGQSQARPSAQRSILHRKKTIRGERGGR